jgi:DNA mismatch endonuclease (patch repair protein)
VGSPDLVFPRYKIAVFCDGDFWHGKNWESRRPKLLQGWNGSYWVAKIEKNMDRDMIVSETLSEQGWLVLRFWESDLRRNLDMVVNDVLAAVASRPCNLQRSDNKSQ